MNRSILIILGILVLGSAGFGIAQLNEVQKLKQSIADWEKERADFQQRIADLQKRNSDLEQRRSPSFGAATPIAVGGPLSDEPRLEVAGGPPAFRTAGRAENGRMNMMGTPEMQKLMAVQQKAGLDGRYASLFKKLNLSPADLEKFKSLLVEKQSAVMDVMEAARAEGLTGRENRDQVRDLVQQTQGEVENTIRATLGDAAYAQYQNFEVTQPQRQVVSQLEQRLSYSTTPLTDTQSQQLVQILAETSPVANNNRAAGNLMIAGGGFSGVRMGGNVQITQDAVTRAQGILTAQQLSALQSLQQEQQTSAQLMQQMRDARQNQASSTGARTAPTVTK